MAAKPQRASESKKRKGISGPKDEERKSTPKKLKLQSSNPSQKGPKKPFKSSEQPRKEQRKQLEDNSKIQKGDSESKKESRIRAKVQSF